ncbi:MAG: cobyrinate a,c-diamide synthase [Thermodesulfovibrionales bacterium]|nr:cobyrinate a,c-diamide synthase [Thermodesulfovibrionales bacterium]
MHSKFLLAGTHSGSGKTTLTIGILGALLERGIKVQSFKAGPDFIDTGLHGIVTGSLSVNLDLWMMGDDYVKGIFNKYSEGMDAVIIEGVMGLFDGTPSAADLARFLKVPVILIIDAYGMAESIRPVVRGYMEEAMDKGIRISGLIFNRTGGIEHYKRLRESIRDLNIEVFGHLPRNRNFQIPSRHLGLYRAEESPLSEDAIGELKKMVNEFIEIDSLLKKTKVKEYIPSFQSERDKKITVGIARDEAFSFYYRDVLDGLREQGAEIIEFSPLNHEAIPDNLDFIYIGGGYPELYAERLSRNHSMKESIRKWIQDGLPLYAECGGLMYLSRGIYIDNLFYPMTGALPFTVRMMKRPVLGYRYVELINTGIQCRGHEFHYSMIEGGDEGVEKIFRVFSKDGIYLKEEGYLFKKTLSTYIHLHNIDRIIKWLTEGSWTK